MGSFETLPKGPSSLPATAGRFCRMFGIGPWNEQLKVMQGMADPVAALPGIRQRFWDLLCYMDQESGVADLRAVPRMGRVGGDRLHYLWKEDLACGSWVVLLAHSGVAAPYQTRRSLQRRENSKISAAFEAGLV